MPMSSEANDSTPRRRSSVLRLLATGALTLLAGGIIAGCAATAPAAPTATAAPKTEVATVAPAAPTEPTATAAAPEGVPPGPPPGGAGGPPKVITAHFDECRVRKHLRHPDARPVHCRKAMDPSQSS